MTIPFGIIQKTHGKMTIPFGIIQKLRVPLVFGTFVCDMTFTNNL